MTNDNKPNQVKKVLVLCACLLFPSLAFAVSGSFDHLSTGFPLDGQHRQAACDSCHEKGLFKGTPTRCVACHTGAAHTGAEVMPVDHIRAASTCKD